MGFNAAPGAALDNRLQAPGGHGRPRRKIPVPLLSNTSTRPT